MHLALALVAASLLLVACGGGETTRTVTDVETVTVTVTVTVAADPGLPEPVAEKRASILAAAEAGDYDAVAALARTSSRTRSAETSRAARPRIGAASPRRRTTGRSRSSPRS